MSHKLQKVIFNRFRLIHLGTIVATLLLMVVSRYQINSCDNVTCLYESVRAFYRPLLIFLEYFIYFILSFLVLPISYFRRWLLYVASWGLPLLFILVGSSSPYSSGIMTGRAFDAQLGTILFIGFSAVAIVGFFIYDVWQWYRSDKTLRDI